MLAAVALLSLGVIFFWSVVVPFFLGTIEWYFNIGRVRR